MQESKLDTASSTSCITYDLMNGYPQGFAAGLLTNLINLTCVFYTFKCWYCRNVHYLSKLDAPAAIDGWNIWKYNALIVMTWYLSAI